MGPPLPPAASGGSCLYSSFGAITMASPIYTRFLPSRIHLFPTRNYVLTELVFTKRNFLGNAFFLFLLLRLFPFPLYFFALLFLLLSHHPINHPFLLLTFWLFPFFFPSPFFLLSIRCSEIRHFFPGFVGESHKGPFPVLPSSVRVEFHDRKAYKKPRKQFLVFFSSTAVL